MTLPPIAYPFAVPPAPGGLTEVAPGLGWARMPLPFALDHVNLWVLDADSTTVAVVDCGVGDDATHALWDAVLAGPLAGRRIDRLIATHFHPDHMGAAGWLCQRFSVPLTTSLPEWLYGRMLWLEDDPDYHDNQAGFYRRLGLDAGFLAGIAVHRNTYRPRIDPVPPRFLEVRSGDLLPIGGRSWRVIQGGGHSPAHVCLYCAEAGVLISGDQILPRISPIIGVWPQQPDGDPLADFLSSLDLLAELPDDTLVLPSHGLPFRGMHARIAQLRAHHAERLDLLRGAVTAPATVAEMMTVLFPRPMEPAQVMFAVGETMAHLACLVGRGDLVREVDAAGCWRYRA